jgi:predicted dehydrogenase
VFGSAPSATQLVTDVHAGRIGEIVRADLRLHFAEWPRAWHSKAQWLRFRDQGGWIREVASHFLFLAGRVLGPLELGGSSVTFADGDHGELCEIDASARFTTPAAPLVMIGTSGGVGPDVVDLTIRGTTGSERIVDWYRLQSTTGGEWIDELGTDRVQLGSAAYAAQLGQLSRLLDGAENSLATFDDALVVQEVVESMLLGR